MGAKSGKGGNDLFDRKIPYALSRPFKNHAKTFRGCVGSLFVFCPNGGRAYEKIAVDGGSNEDSLSSFVWKGKYCPCHMASCFPVKETVISAARLQMDFLTAYHIVKLISVKAGCIYHISCTKASLCSAKLIALCQLFYLFYFCLEFKFYSVCPGIFCQCKIQFKGADDSGCGSIQSCISLL